MSMEPFEQLAGEVLTVYLAPVGEAVPDVDTTPAGNWVALGATDGGQKIKDDAPATKFYDDNHQGPVKAVRPKEDKVYSFNLVDSTLEALAKVTNDPALISTDTTPNIKKLPLKRGSSPKEWAMLLRGPTSSPYAGLPAQFVVPRGFFDGAHEWTFSKTERNMTAVEFAALEDDTVVDEDDRMGYLIVQTS